MASTYTSSLQIQQIGNVLTTEQVAAFLQGLA